MTVMAYDGNLFLLPSGPRQAAAVTTNGVVKADGKLVMGAGIARYARDSFPGIDAVLGEHVKCGGNVPAWLPALLDPHREAAGLDPKVNVVTCPTKRHWKDPSDPGLIAASCRKLVEMAGTYGLERVYLPPLGCANGGLDWKRDVEPVCSAVLDDRFTAAVPRAMLEP